MVRQTRAEHTRHALITAAATEFDQHGYAGTSLAAVTKAAGVTMGALTFHFRTKADLAVAVCAEGETVTRAALDRMIAELAPDLRSVVELCLEITRLLGAEVSVRAAARLAQERATAHDRWHSVWTAALRDLLKRIRAADGLNGDAEDLELLAVYLMAGAEAFVRAGHPAGSVQKQLGCLWTLTLDGFPGAPRQPLCAPDRGPSTRTCRDLLI